MLQQHIRVLINLVRRKLTFVTNEIFHVYNRGVAKQAIFLDKYDYQRFLNILRWHQSTNYSYSKYIARLQYAKLHQVKEDEIIQFINTEYSLSPPLVKVHAWTLMPNHYHLVTEQTAPNGIVQFMHRVGNAYAHYFCRKYDHSGSVFQGRFKGVWVADETQFVNLCRYVHINPLSAQITTPEKLIKYPWTSLQEYLNPADQNQHSALADGKLLLSQFNTFGDLYNFTLTGLQPHEKKIIKNLTIDDDWQWYKKDDMQNRLRKEKLVDQAISQL